jgi:hypothetical protein
MKFYNGGKLYSVFYFNKISKFKLTAIYHFFSLNSYHIKFFKDGNLHNSKNAAYIRHDVNKHFCLNGIYYGRENNFTKKSWLRFIKMKVFL